MGTARRRWSPDEKKTVLKLAEEGYTHKQIADKLRPGVNSAWRSVGEIIRESRKPKAQPAPVSTPAASGVQTTPIAALPTSYAKVQLPSEMVASLSAKEFMTMMDDDQRRLFIGTYKDLRGDADSDSLTAAENEMLIRAAYSNVKYLKAQTKMALAETYLMAEMEGGLTDSDEDKAKKRFAGRGDSYKKESEQWHKEYMELLNDLKLTRKQRLDKIKDTRNTFLDLQQELTNKLRRGSLVEEIKRINLATEDEFRRMAKGEPGPDGKTHPWLIGAFDEYVNPPEQLEDTGDKDEHST